MTKESFCKSIWNLSYDQVRENISKDSYKQFEIPKKNGMRIITFLPEESSLYDLQKKFNKNFLSKQELPICVKGFVKGESYISYLEPHVGSKYFFRVDIKDFFPSITVRKIKEAFSTFISFETDTDKEIILELISDICTYEDILPQGASTSPTISNIIMVRIDQRITKYCQALGVTYTRYADDLLFSSKNFDFKFKKWFVKKIKFFLSSSCFSINYSKMKFGNEEISLNGYVISETGIRLSRGRLSDLKKALAFSRENHRLSKDQSELFLEKANNIVLVHRNLKRDPFASVFQFTQFLIGYRSHLISFLQYDLEPSFRKKIKKMLYKIEEQLLLY